ncbi:MAG: MATE family efflux transporter [Acidimicrobiia bacterium]|nr:MATE family efflux transporter [Acidimicrobiia bacterium]
MQDFTTGPLPRHLLKTSGFMLVTMVLQTLYVLVDLYWVGRIGTQAIAAVAISGNLMFIVLAATQMLGVGTTTLVSHAVGRKDHVRAVLVFNQAQALSMVVGVVFLVVVMAFRVPYATQMSADAETAQLAADYLFWFIPAMALQFALVAIGAALRGVGNFKVGSVVGAVTILINLVLAPFLMFGWLTGRPLGIAGAAIASLVAIVAGILWLVVYFIPRESYLTLAWRQWKPQLDLWRDLLKIGLPAGAEFALMAVYLFMVYVVSRPFGAAAQAGFGIGGRVLQACFMPAVALGFSAAPVAGQNFGARQAQRVKDTFRTAALMAGSVMMLTAMCFWLFPGPIIRVFSADPQAISVGTEYLTIIAFSFVASGIVFVTSSMFQAVGNTIPPLVSSATRIVLIAVPLFLLARLPGFQLAWVWYLSVAGVWIHLGLNLFLLRREFRLKLNFGATPAAV